MEDKMLLFILAIVSTGLILYVFCTKITRPEDVTNRSVNITRDIFIFFIVMFIVFIWPLAVEFGFCDWGYENRGSGLEIKEVSYITKDSNIDSLSYRYHEKGKMNSEHVISKNVKIIIGSKDLYVIKKYSKRLVMKSWSGWILSPLFFGMDKEKIQVYEWEFHIPRD